LEKPSDLLLNNKVKLITKSPCLDFDGIAKDAAANKEDKTICVDAKSLSRLPAKKLVVELFSLLIHEMTHIYGFDSENDAEFMQSLAVEASSFMLPEAAYEERIEQSIYLFDTISKDLQKFKAQMEVSENLKQKLPLDVVGYYMRRIDANLESLDNSTMVKDVWGGSGEDFIEFVGRLNNIAEYYPEFASLLESQRSQSVYSVEGDLRGKEFEKILRHREIFQVKEDAVPQVMDEALVIENLNKIQELMGRFRSRYNRFLSGKTNLSQSGNQTTLEYFSWTKHLLDAGVKLHSLPVLE
jgi:hypothetical protein